MMRQRAKPFAVEVRRSRKPVESIRAGSWVGQMLALADGATNVSKPVPQASHVLWQPAAEPVAPRRILPDLLNQALQDGARDPVAKTRSTLSGKQNPARRKPQGPLEQRPQEIAKERRKRLAHAKRQALKAVRNAIADLNALGFDYRLMKANARTLARHLRSGGN